MNDELKIKIEKIEKILALQQKKFEKIEEILNLHREEALRNDVRIHHAMGCALFAAIIAFGSSLKIVFWM